MRLTLCRTRGALTFKRAGSTLSSFSRRWGSHWSNGYVGSMRNWENKKKEKNREWQTDWKKEERNQEWKIQRNKGIMWSAYNKDTKSSWRRQYVERQVSCQRFNLKREELLAVINVSYGERKSRWRKFSFHNSIATSHIKRRSYKPKKRGGQDTEDRK